MAHFAKLDENNKIITVVVVHNNELLDENGVEQEQKGINFLKSLFGQDTKWVQTSYNKKFRYNYAAIDGKYDPVNDAFIERQRYPSWTLDETFNWKPPVPMPSDTDLYSYQWDEENQVWVIVGEMPPITAP